MSKSRTSCLAMWKQVQYALRGSLSRRFSLSGDRTVSPRRIATRLDARLGHFDRRSKPVESSDYKERKAPYAPVSAFLEFLDKIPNKSVPSRVDRNFLQKLNVATGNEWALLSALKFLGIIDAQGTPTTEYRRLLDSEHRQESLRNLVEVAYAPLLAMGGADIGTADLVNYFRVASSPSQARNAARFFQSVMRLAGGTRPAPRVIPEPLTVEASDDRVLESKRPTGDRDTILAEAKARLLEKLPGPDPRWSAAEYAAIMDRFLEILRHLDS